MNSAQDKATSDLLRGAAKGDLNRRQLIRRGLKAGLGVSGVIGLVAMSGTQGVSAKATKTIRVPDDITCARACGFEYDRCKKDQENACKEKVEECLSKCYWTV